MRPNARGVVRIAFRGVRLFVAVELLFTLSFSDDPMSHELTVSQTMPRRIFVAVMTGRGRLNALEIQLAAGLSDLAHLPYVEQIWYYGHRPLRGNHSFIGPRYVDVKTSPQDRSINILCSKLHAAIGMFLQTQAAWILRICDEASVNVETFEQFMRELDAAGDPLRDRIIQGHAIPNSSISYVYPQGGLPSVCVRACI
jgi:hypothetical protein